MESEVIATNENTPNLCFYATIQPGEAVYHSAVCTLAPQEYQLVQNKGDRLEIYLIKSAQCRLELQQSIKIPGWAAVMAIDRCQPDLADPTLSAKTDSIVLITKRNRLLCYGYVDTGVQLVGQADLSEGTMRPPRRPLLAVADGIAICHVSQGLLRMVNLRNFPRTGRHATKAVPTVRIDELSLLDMQISAGLLVVLCRQPNQKTGVRHYAIPEFSRSSSAPKLLQKDADGEDIVMEADCPAYRLVAREDSYLILTTDHVLFHCPAKAIKVGRTLGSVVFEAVCAVEADRFVGIDTDGMLYSISIVDNQLVNVDRLGRIGRACCLSYLGDGLLFVGSDCGDSQLLQLLPAASSAGHYFTVLSTLQSMAPINNSMLVDMDNTGHLTLVSAVGLNRNGGLSFLRKGVGLNLQQETEFPLDISRIDYFLYKGRRYLTVRLIEESYVFAVGDRHELEESSERFIPSGETILLTKNVLGGSLMVITARRISIYRENGERKSTAFADQPCELASVSSDLIGCVMLCQPGQVKIYQCSCEDLSANLFGAITDLSGEISALDIKKASGDVAIVAVSFWNSTKVQLFKVQSGSVECVLSVDCTQITSTVKSILMISAGDSNWYVFLGCIDGMIGYFRTFHITDFQILSTSSTRPIRLFKYSRDSIFCAGDHPCFVRVDKGGLMDVLPVDIPDISAFTHLGDPSKRLVAIAHGSKLAICMVDPVEKARRHLKTVRLRDLDLPVFGSQLHQILRHEYPISVSVSSNVIAVCTNDDTPSFVSCRAYSRQGRIVLFNKKTLTGTCLVSNNCSD